MVITSTEDVASVHGSFPSALCNEDRPIREVGAGVARLCAVSQLTTGYRGNRNWRDMSEYAVHFTKPAATSSPYDVMIKILWEGRINAVTPLGAARKLAHLGDSQKTACFSEIPLDLLGRLIERRSLYGIGFRQDFLVAHGGARVWYLDKDGPAAASFNALLAPAITSGVDANDPVWRITPFVDFPGTYGATQYRFEWEREWRVPGGLAFSPDDVAFLFIPEELHVAARSFFEDAFRENTGPAYLCPYVDPRWDMTNIQTAFRFLSAPAVTGAPRAADDACLYCGGPTIDGLCLLCGELSR